MRDGPFDLILALARRRRRMLVLSRFFGAPVDRSVEDHPESRKHYSEGLWHERSQSKKQNGKRTGRYRQRGMGETFSKGPFRLTVQGRHHSWEAK
ncbi:hypothetical protein KC338_g170 [Hortaea werneckii]|nr:hypothetical protein KC338_g170 [Hortaea werneckii]